MKKVLKAFLVIIIVLLVGGLSVLLILSKRPAVPSDFREKVQTGGEIEAKFFAKGQVETLYSALGYETAWFLWTLCRDEDAGRAFKGDAAEILSNPNYQDIRKDF